MGDERPDGHPMESAPSTPPGRGGRLGALLDSGRLDSLLQSGGVTVGPAPVEAAELDARRSARRIELDRLLARPARLADAVPLRGGAPTSLDAVVADLTLPSRPILERRTAARGRVTTLTWRHPFEARHGNWSHGAALAAPTSDLPGLLRDDRLGDFSVRQTLFLDIESTGLSHGAGTCAFLVGLAWFEDDGLVLELLFLEDPSDEGALLDHFVARRKSRPYLASFNGRCYDVHVLQSRLVLHRVSDEATSELQLTPHVDLLHFARAIHGGRFENNRLQTLEREVLGFPRPDDDVPGELIPGLYFQYLQTGDVAPLAAVFRHNAWDVLSMVGLYAHLCEVAVADGAGAPPTVAANLGHAWLTRGHAARAERVLARALSAAAVPRDAARPGCAPPLPEDVRRRALWDRVTALKRCLRARPGDFETLLARLAETLSELAAADPASPEPHVELSKLHEHHTRDFPAALRGAETALQRLPPTATAEERAAAERRVARLAARGAHAERR